MQPLPCTCAYIKSSSIQGTPSITSSKYCPSTDPWVYLVFEIGSQFLNHAKVQALLLCSFLQYNIALCVFVSVCVPYLEISHLYHKFSFHVDLLCSDLICQLQLNEHSCGHDFFPSFFFFFYLSSRYLPRKR